MDKINYVIDGVEYKDIVLSISINSKEYSKAFMQEASIDDNDNAWLKLVYCMELMLLKKGKLNKKRFTNG